MSGHGEFDLIARYFAPLATSPGAYGLKDDAALLAPLRGRSLVLTKDAIVEGVHYLLGDPPDQVARKLLRVNLSDLAAKGATPHGYLLACAFPKKVDARWIAAFARGLKHDQSHFALTLLGGDTVATPGPAVFSATMIGHVANRAIIRRAGARAGDLLCVTGTIGDGGFGLTELRTPQEGLAAAQRRFLIARYRLPQPRTRLGPLLAPIASAALDVSDGLVQDAEHLAAQSNLRLEIDTNRVPLSPAGQAIARRDPAAGMSALSAGDDYEILFTVPPRRLEALKRAALAAKTRVTVIGRATRGQGVDVLGEGGKLLALSVRGYDHFTR